MAQENLDLILKRRLASGDITENEYERLKIKIGETVEDESFNVENDSFNQNNNSIIFDKYGITINHVSVKFGSQETYLKDIVRTELSTVVKIPFTEISMTNGHAFLGSIFLSVFFVALFLFMGSSIWYGLLLYSFVFPVICFFSTRYVLYLFQGNGSRHILEHKKKSALQEVQHAISAIKLVNKL